MYIYEIIYEFMKIIVTMAIGMESSTIVIARMLLLLSLLLLLTVLLSILFLFLLLWLLW